MAFEKFKNEIREMDINLLNGELQKRKQLLFQWNNPLERTLDVEGVTQEGNLRTFSKHPFYKIRKEIAIINTFINQIQLRRLQHEQR